MKRIQLKKCICYLLVLSIAIGVAELAPFCGNVKAEGAVLLVDDFESGSYTVSDGTNGTNYTRQVMKNGALQWTFEKNGGSPFMTSADSANCFNSGLVGQYANSGGTVNNTNHLNITPGRLADIASLQAANVKAWHNLVSSADQKLTGGILTLDIRMKQADGSSGVSSDGTSLFLYENPVAGYTSNPNKVCQIRFANTSTRRIRYPYEWQSDTSRAGFDSNTATDASGTAWTLAGWVYLHVTINIDAQTIDIQYSPTTKDKLIPYSQTKSIFKFYENGGGTASSPYRMATGVGAIGFEGTGGLAIDDLKVTYENGAYPPVASGVAITGKPLVGETLIGAYGSYFDENADVENGSACSWIRADDSSFTTNVQVVKSESILAGGNSSYILSESDVGKYIKFSVIPRNNAAELPEGATAEAFLSQAVRVPQTIPIVELLNPVNNARIKKGVTINLESSAVCDNTTITKVEYYAINYSGDHEKIAESFEAPFAAAWSSNEPEDYGIYAKAYNGLGEPAVSQTSHISVYYGEPPQTDPESGSEILYQDNFESGNYTMQEGTEGAGNHYRNIYKDGALQWTFAKQGTDAFSDTFPVSSGSFFVNDTEGTGSAANGSKYFTIGGKQPDQIKAWHNFDKTVTSGIVTLNVRMKYDYVSDSAYPLSMSFYDAPFTGYSSTPKKVFEIRFTRVSAGARIRYPWPRKSDTSRGDVQGITSSVNPDTNTWINFKIGVNLDTKKVDVQMKPYGYTDYIPFNNSLTDFKMEFYANSATSSQAVTGNFTRANAIAAMAFDGASNGVMTPFSNVNLSMDDVLVTHESASINLYKEDDVSLFDGILKGNSTVYAKSIVSNTTGKDKPLQIIMAAYDDQNKLVGISLGDKKLIANGDTQTLAADMAISQDIIDTAAVLNAFVWNSDTLEPFMKHKSVALSTDLIGDKQLDIYILAGQSNMSGRADIASSESGPMERTYLFNNDNRWSVASQPLNKYSILGDTAAQMKMGPGYTFATTLTANLPDVNLGLVVNAKGGSSIAQWAKGGFYYENTVAKAKEAQKYGKVKGILWHQGSSDASNYGAYMASLMQFVSDLRTDLGDQTIPFIAGQLMPSSDNRIHFNEMITTISQNIPYSSYVSADGLTAFDVTTHFDTASQRILGRRYAAEILRMVYGINTIQNQ